MNVTSFKLIIITFLATWLVSLSVFASNQIKGVRVWPAPENTRLVFDLSKTPEYSYFSLTKPDRLVIDFKDSKNLVSLKELAKNDNRIKKIRTSKPKHQGGIRVVLELAQSYQLSVFPLAPAGQYGNRLVVDLYDKKTLKQTVTEETDNGKRDIVVAIVAGHGGEDPGSIGPRGTYEKHVTLSISKKLAELINRKKGLQAKLIRTGDYYINHNRKTKLARQHKADLLISIHADAFTSPKPSGASVLVQDPRRANSEFAKWIANRQKESELLGGAGETIKKTKDKNLALTLADMKKEYTMASSYDFAEHAVRQLKGVTKLHKKKPEGMSLAVLKSSDIPSVLIETGFISNPQEERNLNSGKHQQKLAEAIYSAVHNYFMESPPTGTLYASAGYKKHKVSRGESLSLLAKRYNISVGELKSANNLRSSTVKIGQTLKIPRAE